MSWYIQKIGKREAVKKAVNSEVNLPSEIKEAILSVLKDEEGALAGVRVEGFGHTCTGPGTAPSSIGKLEVEPIQLSE